MAKCKECGKTVNGRHYCESRKRVMETGSSSVLDDVMDVVGDIVEAVADSLNFD